MESFHKRLQERMLCGFSYAELSCSGNYSDCFTIIPSIKRKYTWGFPVDMIGIDRENDLELIIAAWTCVTKSVTGENSFYP